MSVLAEVPRGETSLSAQIVTSLFRWETEVVGSRPEVPLHPMRSLPLRRRSRLHRAHCRVVRGEGTSVVLFVGTCWDGLCKRA